MAPAHEEIQTRIKTVLTERLSQPREVDQLQPETGIMNRGLALDSVSLLEFVIGLENEFDIILDDESLTIDRFETIASLVNFIQSKLEHKNRTERDAA